MNVGGGIDCSLSLLEATALCAEITGHGLKVDSVPATRPGDIPVYVSDCTALRGISGWGPRRSATEVLADLHEWIKAHERELQRAL